MATATATRIAALGLWAIAIAERSGDAAAQLLEQGIKPPIGSGHPVEVFTMCGIGAFESLLNHDMMPEGIKMRIAIQVEQPRFQRIAQWENDSGDRRVTTVYEPNQHVFLTICQGTPNMVRPIQSQTTGEAMRAHHTIIAMVRAGQL